MDKDNRVSEILNYLSQGGYSLKDATWAIEFIKYLKSNNYSLDDLTYAINSINHCQMKKVEQNLNIKTLTAQILYNLGVASDPDGYVYCIDAVFLTYENPQLAQSDFKVLYEAIAKMHNVTCSRVWRSIRTIIDKVFAKTPEAVYRKYLGDIVLRRRYNISNKDFIILLVNYIRNEKNSFD